MFAALRDNVNDGLIWIYLPSLPTRSIVKITNKNSGDSVYCEALCIENNFLSQYNQKHRIPINSRESAIVLNSWYRHRLGSIFTQKDYEFDIHPVNSWWGKVRACMDHPQVVVRVAVWLGLFSVLLGLIGLFLGIISLL